MPATVQFETTPHEPAGPFLRLWHCVPVLVALLLPLRLILSYIGDPAVPGNHGRFPNGWWGWWDQSQYLLSARSLAAGDLAPGHHWYPTGYAMLGAPFTLLSELHPYLLPDLACVVLALFGFLAFARALGVGRSVASLLFFYAVAGTGPLRSVWAEPWNTTLSAALIWGLLGLTARHLSVVGDAAVRRFGRMVALGAIAGFMPMTRPTDTLLVVIWAAGAGVIALSMRRLTPADAGALLLGAVLSFVPSASLWFAIHGTAPSDYVRNSAALGFDWGTLGWRAYLLLVSPRPWFPDGAGMLAMLPWLIPSVGGLLAFPWLVRGLAFRLALLLAAMIVCYSALFCSYVDLIPPGLWRYNNIHYFKWALPGMILFGWLLVRQLAAGPGRPGFRGAILASVAALLIADLRLVPRRAGAAAPAWMVQVQGAVPGWDESYFGHITLRDSRGELLSIRDFRALPDEQGWRFIALRRPFEGPLRISGIGHWPDGAIGPGTAGITRWTRVLGFRLPFKHGRHTVWP
ncbi:hypothetical protein NFI95_04220 [Acetobacteraceae bacterium KSS8]|uniref:Glycosyltransferase RgtA/B/C/D-like domain-containing protein n=1 Tax=Endosaccharibacter trunci TaxID=2812733 RepID=A0ABT1W451_9PROT|nr:hypothetical protein [Acetobacteraceae bacterium KSS8]